MHDITTVAGRKLLTPRREPYWRREGEGYLGFRCTGANGDGKWIGRVRDGGQKYQALGRFDDYRVAAKALQQWLRERTARRHAGVPESAKNATVRDAVCAYLEDFRHRKGEGLGLRYATNILEPKVIGRAAAKRKLACDSHPIALVRLADLTKTQFKAWRAGLLPSTESNATRAQKATATRHYKALVAALNFAKREGLAVSDAAWADVPAFGDVQARTDESHRYLTPCERRSLINACGDSICDFVRLLVATGARPIELVRATAGDFNKRTGELSLWDKKGRSGQPRIRRVALAALPDALVLVTQLVKGKLPAAPLFNHDGDKEFYLLPFKAAVKRAGLPLDVTSYSLRHSFISDAVSAGVPILTVAQTVGTSVQQIERTYSKVIAAHAAEAFGRMARI